MSFSQDNWRDSAYGAGWDDAFDSPSGCAFEYGVGADRADRRHGGGEGQREESDAYNDHRDASAPWLRFVLGAVVVMLLVVGIVCLTLRCAQDGRCGGAFVPPQRDAAPPTVLVESGGGGFAQAQR